MKALHASACALLLLGALPFGTPAAYAGASDNGTYVTINVPGAVCLDTFGFCTTPIAINSNGAIVGYYSDQYGAVHGFLRSPGGNYTRIDPPETLCPPTQSFDGSFCNFPTAISDSGAITGFYRNRSGIYSGYIRRSNGTFTTFDVPGAAGGTEPFGINPEGAVTGQYFETDLVSHGFVRSPDGRFSTFDPAAGYPTAPVGINPQGTVAGFYGSDVPHGFLRDAKGSLSSFDPPGSTFTSVAGINPAGEIAGSYFSGLDVESEHGYLRKSNGAFASFDVPGSLFGTSVSALSPSSAVAGQFYTDSGHGFLRTRDGRITPFDPPGSAFTYPTGMNAAGIVIGWWFDATTSLQHNFIRLPWSSK